MEPETDDWSLSDEQRAETVKRLAQNIASLAFSAGASVSDDVASGLAVAAEKKSYTVARVEARTTTGVRPHSETLRAYTRKLGTLAIDAAKDLVELQKAQQHGPASTGAVSTSQAVTDEAHLDLTGDREFLIEETAREQLSPLLAEGAAHTKIKLSTKSFGKDAALVASGAIANVAGTLLHADLSDVIAGRPEDEALEVLGIFAAALAKANLRHLDVSDNALGEKGVRALAEAITGQALEKLAFQNVGCSIHACLAVEELMQNTGELRVFHFHNNMSGDEGAAAIAQVISRSPMMEDFKMASSRVGPEGGIALLKALTQTRRLVKLDLHDNPLTPEVAEDLALALEGQDALEELNLNDTSLGDEGIRILAKALAGNAPKLHTLELALNEITPEGAEALSECLAAKKHLRKLNLRENELEDDGASWIAKGLAGLESLETVDMCANQITRAGAVGLAQVVSSKAHLKLIALDENAISEAGIKRVKEILDKTGKLHVLGPLDENDPEGDEDGEEADEDASGDEDDAGLADALTSTHIE